MAWSDAARRAAAAARKIRNSGMNKDAVKDSRHAMFNWLRHSKASHAANKATPWTKRVFKETRR